MQKIKNKTKIKKIIINICFLNIFNIYLLFEKTNNIHKIKMCENIWGQKINIKNKYK